MNSKTNFSVCGGVEVRHTQTQLKKHSFLHKFVFFLALMVSLGSMQKAKAQSIDIDAPSVINVSTFVSISLNSACPVNSVTWNLDGGTILNSYNNGTVIDVRWNSAGYKYISASAIVVCNYQQQLVYSNQASIQVVQPPITISGYVTNNCGTGVSGVTIAFGGFGGFGNYSVVTDGNGFYSLVVPYNYSGSGNASKAGHAFSPSQSTINTTANVSLNFSVAAGALQGASLSVTRSQFFTTFGGLIPGNTYYYKYFNASTATWSEYVGFTAWQSSHIVQLSNPPFTQVCLRDACGSGNETCN